MIDSKIDEWPGGFLSGQYVTGWYGNGIIATRNYCLGVDLVFKDKIVLNKGIRPGLVPVIFDNVGCFWQAPHQLKLKGE